MSSSCSPRKYQGAFEGLGVSLKLASSSSGALTKIEKMVLKAVMNSAAANSTTSRCGQTWTLSWGRDLTSWMDPDLDHGEQALGVSARAGRRSGCGSGGGHLRGRWGCLGSLSGWVAGRGRFGCSGTFQQVRRDFRGGSLLLLGHRAFVGGGRGLTSGLSCLCGGFGPRLLGSLAKVFGDFDHSLISLRPTADPRCRRLCAPAKNGSP